MDDHDAHLRLLGLTTARGHQLELVTSQILAQALRIADGNARLLMSAMGMGAALTVLADLVGRQDCGSLSPAALGAWLPKAKTANTARNRVIHTPWVATRAARTVPDSVLEKNSMRLVSRTDAELRQDIQRMALAVDAGYELLGQRHKGTDGR